MWNDLDSNNIGSIPTNEISRIFRSEEHPLVTLGNAAHAEVLKQFVLLTRTGGGTLASNINIKTKIQVVYKQAFIDYYSDLSAGVSSIDNADATSDAFFEKVVVGNWL